MYQIKDWDEYYENAGSRKIEHCSWCPIPNKQDGLGYALLIQGRSGPSFYAAFVATVLVCSKHTLPRNGWITDNGKENGRPLTAYDLHLKTKLPEKTIEEMLKRASKPDIGWIDLKSPSIDSEVVAPYKPDTNKTEQNRTESTESIVRVSRVIEIFHDCCKSLPKVRAIGSTRENNLRARIKEYPNEEFWIEYFKRVEKSDFLTGRSGKWNGCGFDFLIKQGNFIKTLEGNYDNPIESFGAEDMPENIIAGSRAERDWLDDHGLIEKSQRL